MRKIKTDEEKVAKALTNLVNDLTLDVEQVGVYLGRESPNVSLRRLTDIMETANEERKATNVRN
jgi:predicted RNA binding protein with dsRBD fold (UPF0201 family)